MRALAVRPEGSGPGPSPTPDSAISQHRSLCGENVWVQIYLPAESNDSDLTSEHCVGPEWGQWTPLSDFRGKGSVFSPFNRILAVALA